MPVFSQRLRERARELGLSNAEVARRAGISERRYAYYAMGEREPNLATLLRICEVLAATPNDMLLSTSKPAAQSRRRKSSSASQWPRMPSFFPGGETKGAHWQRLRATHRPSPGWVVWVVTPSRVARRLTCLQCLVSTFLSQRNVTMPEERAWASHLQR